MSDQDLRHDLVCIVCGAHRTVRERCCPKCSGMAAVATREGAEIMPRRLAEFQTYHKHGQLTCWSRHLQRYIYRSEWTKQDLDPPNYGTALRFPGSDGTQPIGIDEGEQQELDLSARYDLRD